MKCHRIPEEFLASIRLKEKFTIDFKSGQLIISKKLKIKYHFLFF